MSAPWPATAGGLDLATAVCAALNLSYFFDRLAIGRREAASRRWAAVALVLVSLGALVESLFFLTMLLAAPAESPLASLPWALGGRSL